MGKVNKDTMTTLTRVLMLGVGLLVGVLAAEVGLRLAVPGRVPSGVDNLQLALERTKPVPGSGSIALAGLLRPSANPDRVFELRPNLRCIFRGATVVTNSFGMREREVPRTKPAGTLRVVGLGDSVMFGWGVSIDSSYLRVTEDMLSDRGLGSAPVEILNFGVPGYNTAMQVALFDELASGFDPDAVVLHFVNNDLELPRFMLEPARPWSLDRLWLADLFRGGWTTVAGSGGWVAPGDLARMGDGRGARVRSRYAHLSGEPAYRRAMRRLSALTAELAVPVVFLTLQTDGEPWGMAASVAREHGFLVAEAGPRYLRYMKDHGFEPTRKGWTLAFSISDSDPHPNRTGHRLFAETLIEALDEGLDLPR